MMTRMNRFFGLLVALALAAFALPASSAPPPTKMYSLDITSTAVSPGGGGVVALLAGGGKVYLTIKNETPSGGNSAISSFIVKKQPGVKFENPAGRIRRSCDAGGYRGSQGERLLAVGPEAR